MIQIIAERIALDLYRGKKNYLVYGSPYAGKTHFLEKVNIKLRDCDKRFPPVQIDLSKYDPDDENLLIHIYVDIFNLISSKQHSVEQFNSFLEVDLELFKILAGNVQLYLILDNIDLILGPVAIQLLQGLGTLSTNLQSKDLKHFSFIISSSIPVRDYFQESDTTLSPGIHELAIPFLHESEVREHVEYVVHSQGGGGIFSLDEYANILFHWTNGHPQLLQLLLNKIPGENPEKEIPEFIKWVVDHLGQDKNFKIFSYITNDLRTNKAAFSAFYDLQQDKLATYNGWPGIYSKTEQSGLLIRIGKNIDFANLIFKEFVSQYFTKRRLFAFCLIHGMLADAERYFPNSDDHLAENHFYRDDFIKSFHNLFLQAEDESKFLDLCLKGFAYIYGYKNITIYSRDSDENILYGNSTSQDSYDFVQGKIKGGMYSGSDEKIFWFSLSNKGNNQLLIIGENNTFFPVLKELRPFFSAVEKGYQEIQSKFDKERRNSSKQKIQEEELDFLQFSGFLNEIVEHENDKLLILALTALLVFKTWNYKKCVLFLMADKVNTLEMKIFLNKDMVIKEEDIFNSPNNCQDILYRILYRIDDLEKVVLQENQENLNAIKIYPDETESLFSQFSGNRVVISSDAVQLGQFEWLKLKLKSFYNESSCTRSLIKMQCGQEVIGLIYCEKEYQPNIYLEWEKKFLTAYSFLVSPIIRHVLDSGNSQICGKTTSSQLKEIFINFHEKLKAFIFKIFSKKPEKILFLIAILFFCVFFGYLTHQGKLLPFLDKIKDILDLFY